jgi:hypothetical protein
MADRITVEGFVEKLFVKEGTSARGPWKAYSIKVQRASGEVDPRFYQFGFDAPKFVEGDYIRFEADIKDDKAAQFVKNSGSKPKNPPTKPAAPAKPPYTGPKGGGGYQPRKPLESKVFGQIGGNNTEDDIRRMAYSNARSAALAAVATLLSNDGLVTSAAKTKGGQAQRYEEIVAAIDKLTVKYFFDGASGRLLTSVADEGSKESRVAELPDAEPSKASKASDETDEMPKDPDTETTEQEQDDAPEEAEGKF